eukprot:Seg3456.2 transcript_id=Seg3456.2/GoldUCD/mRNA.D3Y31 product="Coiled-coil domain-containing protein 51" protein_id=Seg3456.2/GoldUCD/D3Y31
MYNRYVERVRVHFTNAYSKGRSSIQVLTAKVQPRVNSFMQKNAASAKVKLSGVQKSLDEFFKIKEVTEAQLVVTDTEKKFLDARKLSRKAMKDLNDAEISLEEARKKLDRCPRENENFYKYFSEEHEIFMNKKKLKGAHESSEQLERELFTEYSNAVRISHEKERERAQTTKYWSIIGSISGAIIGFLGSSLITYYRFKQIRKMASPELIINELKSEIQDNGMKQAELKDMLNSSNSILIRSLEQKIDKRNESWIENTHEIASDKDVLSEARNLVSAGKDEMRKELEKQIEELSKGTNKMIVGVQNVTKQVLDENEIELVSKFSKITAKQTEELENTILGMLEKSSSEIISKTGTSIQRECAKLSSNMKEFADHRRDNAVPRILPSPEKTVFIENEVACRWKEDANMAMSAISIVLLTYLIISSKS